MHSHAQPHLCPCLTLGPFQMPVTGDTPCTSFAPRLGRSSGRTRLMYGAHRLDTVSISRTPWSTPAFSRLCSCHWGWRTLHWGDVEGTFEPERMGAQQQFLFWCTAPVQYHGIDCWATPIQAKLEWWFPPRGRPGHLHSICTAQMKAALPPGPPFHPSSLQGRGHGQAAPENV